MSRYTQDQNFNIKGPGLPDQGVVAVGPAELEAAFEAGADRFRNAVSVARAFEGWSAKDIGEWMRGYMMPPQKELEVRK